MSSMQHILFVFSVTVLLCVSTSEPALARVDTFTVAAPVEVYPLRVTPGATVVIQLESPILDTDRPRKWRIKPRLNAGRDTITISVPEKITEREAVGDYIVATRLYTLTFAIALADKDEEVIEGLIVKHKSEREIFLAAVEREVSKRMTERDEEHARELEQATSNGKERALLLELNDGHETRRLANIAECRGTDVICALEWNRFKEFGLLRVAVHNRTAVDIEYTRAQVFDESGTWDHGGMVRVDDGRPMLPGETIIQIPRMGTVDLAVIVRNPAHIGSAVRLSLSGPTVAAASSFVELVEASRRYRMARQTTVSVRGLFGGFWTDDAAGQSMTAGTSVAGIGVRVTKGMSPRFAFEGEFVGGRTGDATFAGVDWGGMQGNVTRRATLGRLLAAGVIRFGDRYVVSTRAGLGVQFASYDSTFDSGGDVMEGPGDGLDMQGIWSVGAGLDARLGERWSVGAAATATSTFQNGPRSFEGSLLVGYGWN